MPFINVYYFFGSKGELYKSTDSFTAAFFVCSGFILVGVSLIYVVQRIRPDLIHKEEPGRQEVYDSSLIPSPSIHSTSVVDTLSGMFITDPSLSASHLDPMEIGSYQRFDSFRREDSRATFLEPVQGRMANQSEVDAVYRQAVDNLDNISNTSGVSVHRRNGSDTSGIAKAYVAAQSRSGSAFSGSILSSSEMAGNLSDSPSDLQITLGETNDLPKSGESCATLVNANIGESPQEGGINIPGDSMILQECDHQEKLSVTSANKYRTATSPTIDIPAVLEAGYIKKPDSDVSDLLTKIQPSQTELDISPEPMITENRDIELGVELVKLPPPPESNRKRRTGALETGSNEQNDTGSISSTDDAINDIEKAFVSTTEGVDTDGETFQDSDGRARSLLVEASSPEKEESVEPQDFNEMLELVRIPPPPAVPRTGQLVTLGTEAIEDRKNVSLTEIKLLNADQDDINEKEVVEDNSSSKDVSTSQRKERLHLAIIDQLNLLSERLEAVAARQIQEEEEEENGERNRPDQRHVFSPALQSLPLTPLYSANHSVPLTPVRAWSSFVSTPAPTPRQTPPSAFLTTAPTPIHTPRTPGQSLSGICTPSDTSMANPSQSNFYETGQINYRDSSNWDDAIDVCSPSSSQSRRRSRCSSFSEVGQEFVLNEWSLRDMHGSTEAFSSKPSSGTNSSVSNSARSMADLNCMSEPIDVVVTTINESHGGHVNSPENVSPNQQLGLSVAMCLPQKPYLQYENTDASRQNLFQQPCLNSNQTELQANQMNDFYQVDVNIPQTLAQAIPQEEHFNNDVPLPQQTYEQFTTTDPKENEHETAGPMDLKPVTVFNCYRPDSVNIPQPDDFSNISTASEPQQKLEFIADSNEIQMQQTYLDPGPPLESKSNPFLESDQKEFTEIFQHNPFQQPSGGFPDGSQNPFHISPGGSVSQHEQPLPAYQPTGISNGQDQYIAEQTDATSSESRSLSQVLPKLNPSPQAMDSHCQSENLVDQQEVPRQSNSTTELYVHTRPEESETGVAEHTLIPSDNAERETDHQLSNQSTWTMFSRSQEGLIFEMDTESESSSDSGVRLENDSASTCRETKTVDEDYGIADQESLFPPLQIFSDIIDITTTVNSQGVPLKLPPPPRQAHRKRTDISVCANTEHPACFHSIHGKDSESQQTSLEDTYVVQETGLAPDTKILVEEHQGTLRLQGSGILESRSVETHSVSSDTDLSATGNSVSEIESDLLAESKLDELTHELSDNSISGIVCQVFESIKDEDETIFTSEEADDSSVDGEMAKTSIHDDIAPLLVQNDEPIQYVNLRDLPEDFHVLQKRPSTTSSTDDSSTSTDSSLSENEMPYSKLHEGCSDTSDQGL